MKKLNGYVPVFKSAVAVNDGRDAGRRAPGAGRRVPGAGCRVPGCLPGAGMPCQYVLSGAAL